MLHGIRQLIIKPIPCAALYDMVGIYSPGIIFGISVREHTAHINKVIVLFIIIPFHRIAPCLMVSRQLHKAQIGEVVAVHINQSDFDNITLPSIYEIALS